MARWVALLRGVNVNGITIRSAELAALFRELGYEDVRTVLASGNVVFTADGDAATVTGAVEQALRDRFGYDAWIVLVPHGRLAAIVDDFPFPSGPDRHDYVVFGSAAPALDALLVDLIVDESTERVARGDGVVYWSCPKGSSTDTAFAKRAAAARFKRTTTTRNTNTLRKLL
ncbi:DUF1697 domain-containing protein [Curtobacterium sp. Csp1]|uniref:DUF1697 domain-containing protein n=1 Tax=Curtobacterium citreum TaxID=2036 RepID=A0ABT2HGT7_9MICO|nr:MULTISPECIES: DUF1697 domain-containing protein [Curtobacterium]MCS6522475.1 DUF1697 domain-containing protein [Curtobacterium citreum]QKS12958.1 DUF1697 domain-containing protein [Curtobacterium sp. csp3]QKS19175.1 DUF1697 domain-containing protein [Curtobacterium sp. Csp1]TQJ26224.1 uncharacterized protein (DUF1697 family) [Curtobacterium citreum]GGL78653.1 pyridoxamine 5'-phosphate oxidase [Curtobacterium citreum]